MGKEYQGYGKFDLEKEGSIPKKLRDTFRLLT